MATVGEYTAEIKLKPLPTTESYRIEVDAYYFGTSGGSPNTLKAFSHTYDWNLATEGVSEDHKLRITDAAIELDPVELLYWNEDATPAKTPLATPAKVTLTQYDAVNGGQGAGAILDTETLYLPAPGAGQSHNFEITTGSARFSSSITKAGAGIEIQQDGNFAKLVATASTRTADDGVRILSNVIQLDIGGLTSLVPASPTLDSLVYWDEDLDSHKRVVIDQMPLTQFSNTGFTVNAEAVNVGTFPAGTWVFPSSSTIQVGSTTGDTPNIQFWDRDTSPGGYLDVISVPAALDLDIGHSSWAVDILGSSVLVNGAAIGTVTRVNITAGNGLSGTTTDTTSGHHTQTLTVGEGDGISVTASAVALDIDGLTDVSTETAPDDKMLGTDQMVFSRGSGLFKDTANAIPLSAFSDDLGYTNITASLGVKRVTNDIQVEYTAGAHSLYGASPSGTGVGTLQTTDRILFADDSDSFNVKHAELSQLPFTNNAGTVTGVTAGTGLDSSGGAAPNITLDLDELGPGGALIGGDHLVAVNGTATQKQLVSAIPLGIFSNNLGWTNNAGTVTQVDGTGTVSGLTLTGSVTASGNLTLGGTLSVTEGAIVDGSILARVASNETITGNWTFPNTTDIGVTSQSYDTLAATDWDRGVGTHVFVNAGATTGEPTGALRGYWFTMGRRNTLGGYAGLYFENGRTLWLGERDDNSTDGSPTWTEVANVGHQHSAADITSGTLGVGRGGTGAATYASGEVLYGGGGTNPIASSTSVTITGGSTLNATQFVGGGVGLTDIVADSSTVTNLGANSNTYYPIMADGASGSVSHFVESSDLFWDNGDKRLEALNLRVLNEAIIQGDTQILGRLNLLYDGTVMHRMTNDDVSLTDKSWDIRIADTTGSLEIRSVQDNGTTVQNPLQIAHATGNVQVNTQFAVKEEQTTLTVAATVNCDWDASNQLHLTITSTVTTINIDDTAMVAGGSYILVVQEGDSAPATVTWSSGTVILWANNNEPTLNGGNSGDMTVVQFFKTTAGDDHIIGSWFLAQ